MSEINQNIREINILGSRTTEILVHAEAVPALREFGIAIVGISYARPPFHFKRPHPAVSQFLGCISGRGEAQLEGSFETCESGQAYVTPEAVSHEYRANHDAVWELCWVMFRPRHAEEIRAAMPQRPALRAFDPLPLQNAIRGLHQESVVGGSPRILALWAGLINSILLRSLQTESGQLHLQRVWDAAQRNLQHDWSLTELARLAGMSSEHLRRLTQTHFAATPLQYLTQMRMREARAMLASGSYTLEAVARRVGYRNPYAFSTAFRRATGCSPGQYRKAQRMENPPPSLAFPVKPA